MYNCGSGSNTFLHWAVFNGTTWDVVDIRTKTIVGNFATWALALADAVTRNRTAAGLP